MKWFSLLGAALALFAATESTHAALNGFCGGSKSFGCAELCQPERCLPTISRPCMTNIYSYQRKNSFLKASCCAPPSCGDSASCCAPVGCGVVCPENSCCAPVACTGAVENTCCAPTECGQGSYCASGSLNACSAPVGCIGSADGCSAQGCCDAKVCQEIAALIYQSMTECYATARRTAIHRLGDRYDCCDHPEIMSAFIYALNDSDERVRSKAADEIGDQIRRNRCCCGLPVIRALRCALADCDRNVRRQAEEALELSGYAIVNGNCSGCVGECCPATGSISYPQASPAANAPAEVIEPAPVPAEPIDQAEFLPLDSYKPSIGEPSIGEFSIGEPSIGEFSIGEFSVGDNSLAISADAVGDLQSEEDSPLYFKARIRKTI